MEQIKITYDKNHEQPVASSLQVAKDFNKNHRDVLKAIEKMKDGVAQNFADLFYKSEYEHLQNRQHYPMYLMNRDGFSLLVMGFTGKDALEWKLKYIQAFNAMEKELREPKKLNNMQMLELQYQVNEKTVQNADEIKEVKDEVNYLKNDARLDPGQYNHIGTLVTGRVDEIRKTRKLKLTSKQNGLLFQGLNREIKEITGVRTRSDLRQKHYDLVCDFIHTWEPSSATVQKIKELGESNV